jgi:hypothetical protein
MHFSFLATSTFVIIALVVSMRVDSFIGWWHLLHLNAWCPLQVLQLLQQLCANRFQSPDAVVQSRQLDADTIKSRKET